MQAYTYHLAKGIVPSDLIDNNQVHTNIVYSTTMASGTHEITTEQAYSNSEIAHQCPLSGGKSVYLARTLYGISHPNEMYEDEQTCLLEGVLLRKAKGLPLHNLEVYPNPASHTINARAILVHDKGNLIIADIFGRIVLIEPIYKGRNENILDLSEIKNGLYIVSLRDGEAISHSVKISLVK
jgi:hypothetical protein